MLKRFKITVFNHGGKVGIISKKPYCKSETSDIVSLEFEDWPLDVSIETKVTEKEVEYARANGSDH